MRNWRDFCRIHPVNLKTISYLPVCSQTETPPLQAVNRHPLQLLGYTLSFSTPGAAGSHGEGAPERKRKRRSDRNDMQTQTRIRIRFPCGPAGTRHCHLAKTARDRFTVTPPPTLICLLPWSCWFTQGGGGSHCQQLACCSKPTHSLKQC